MGRLHICTVLSTYGEIAHMYCIKYIWGDCTLLLLLCRVIINSTEFIYVQIDVNQAITMPVFV